VLNELITAINERRDAKFVTRSSVDTSGSRWPLLEEGADVQAAAFWGPSSTSRGIYYEIVNNLLGRFGYYDPSVESRFTYWTQDSAEAFLGHHNWKLRKYPREIATTAAGGEAGQKARCREDGRVYQHSGSAWALMDDPTAMPDTLEAVGSVQPGDYLGPWFMNGLYDLLNLMHTVNPNHNGFHTKHRGMVGWGHGDTEEEAKTNARANWDWKLAEYGVPPWPSSPGGAYDILEWSSLGVSPDPRDGLFEASLRQDQNMWYRFAVHPDHDSVSELWNRRSYTYPIFYTARLSWDTFGSTIDGPSSSASPVSDEHFIVYQGPLTHDDVFTTNMTFPSPPPWLPTPYSPYLTHRGWVRWGPLEQITTYRFAHSNGLPGGGVPGA
jgi:hypothetical protein